MQEGLEIARLLHDTPDLFPWVLLAVVLLIASMFFNMPLIGRYLLMQSGRYRTAWKVSGFTFATIIATLLAVFVILATLGEIHIGNWLLAITTDTDAWCWLLVASSVLGIEYRLS